MTDLEFLNKINECKNFSELLSAFDWDFRFIVDTFLKIDSDDEISIEEFERLKKCETNIIESRILNNDNYSHHLLIDNKYEAFLLNC